MTRLETNYFVPNVLSPRDLVTGPGNMDETVLSSGAINETISLQEMGVIHQSLVKDLQSEATVQT